MVSSSPFAANEHRRAFLFAARPATKRLRLGRAPALRSAAPAHVVERRRSPARRGRLAVRAQVGRLSHAGVSRRRRDLAAEPRSEEHTSELQSLAYLVCRLLLEKKKRK